ncbi:hypothetical protein BDA96_10G000400 [Sorghum bicolor]|uniref:Uncharacterized protein n=2 Tax=Sorghum bicolor TaxID=4558 RepID=A0A921PZ20_SORBI|nr:hypothetical protein BDA96_10G000400 [Sorghum bicolor]OQU75667.1 hypothetical protein SORBI_3010G000401 [Sorghum bicolor]
MKHFSSHIHNDINTLLVLKSEPKCKNDSQHFEFGTWIEWWVIFFYLSTMSNSKRKIILLICAQSTCSFICPVH